MKRTINGVEYELEDEPRTYYGIMVAKSKYDIPKPILNNTVFESWEIALQEAKVMEREHLRRKFPPYYQLQITEKTCHRLKKPISIE